MFGLRAKNLLKPLITLKKRFKNLLEPETKTCLKKLGCFPALADARDQ